MESEENIVKKFKTEETTFLFDIDQELEMACVETGNILSQCSHSIRVGDLCANCGMELPSSSNLVSVVHSSDQILQSYEKAYEQDLNKYYKLASDKKLILLCDLDQTLLHATLENTKCDFSFELDNTTFYIKFRKGLNKFLKRMNKLFELHVYTMGTREYANEICNKIDPLGEYFDDRIVTRTENNNELKKYIKRITSFSKNVLALDDRLDVWDFIPNVIMIRQFCYYNIDDVNDPIKLAKKKLRTTNKNFLDDSINKLQKELAVTNDTEIEQEYSDLIKKDVNIDVDKQETTSLETLEIKKASVNKNDRELEVIYKAIKKIHNRYFKKLDKRLNKNKVKLDCLEASKIIDLGDVARLKVLKHFKFVCKTKYYNHVIFLGGKIVDPSEFDSIKNMCKEDKINYYIINDKKKATELGLKSLDFDWLLECINTRSFVKIEKYLQ